MEFAKISSRRNNLIKSLKGLQQKKNRDSNHSYFFEGTKLFHEACKWNVPIKEIIVTERRLSELGDAIDSLAANSDNNLSCHIVTPEVYRSITVQKNPEGIFCVAQKENTNRKSARRIVLLDTVRDPGNVGTIIRTADAAGFELIVCSKTCADIYNEKVIRASMGSFFHISCIQCEDLIKFISKIKAEKIPVCGTSLHGIESYDCPILHSNGIALVFGNESHGISEKTESVCDYLWKLPIYGNAESLNVSIAAGIMLYAASRAIYN